MARDADRLGRGVVPALSRFQAAVTYGTAEALTGAPRPLDLRSAAAALRGRPPASVEVWELPDTAHTRALAAHPRQWEQRVVGFLDRALADPGL